MKLKKGNMVKILTGKDKNKSGEVIEINRYLNRAKVKGINIIKKHVKTTKENKGRNFAAYREAYEKFNDDCESTTWFLWDQ